MTTPNEFAEQAGLGMWQAYCDKKQQVEALQEEIERLTGEAVAADIRIANDALVIAGLTAERDALKAERADLLSLALQAKRHHDKVVAELEMSKMKTYAASISPIAKERDELRAALAERDAEIEKLKAKFAALDEATMGKLCMQRAVMQQALYQLEADHYVLRNSLKIADAIAALKEALK